MSKVAQLWDGCCWQLCTCTDCASVHCFRHCGCGFNPFVCRPDKPMHACAEMIRGTASFMLIASAVDLCSEHVVCTGHDNRNPPQALFAPAASNLCKANPLTICAPSTLTSRQSTGQLCQDVRTSRFRALLALVTAETPPGATFGGNTQFLGSRFIAAPNACPG